MNDLVLKKEHSIEPDKRYKFTFLTGEMRGKFFFIGRGERITIGRAKSCNVTIDDNKASREHAELIWFEGRVVVTDLKSQNGIIVNDKKVLQSDLRINDRLVIGKTIIKITEDQEIEESFDLKDYQDKEEKPDSSKSFLFGIVIVLAIVWVLISDDSEEKKREVSSISIEESSNENVIQKIEKNERNKNKKLNRKVANVLRKGLRELREKNYFRAIAEFNHALDLKPQDAQSDFYLRKAKDELDKEIQAMSIDAQTDIEGLKYKKALVSYCGIIRLLHNYPNDQRYIDAKKNIENLEKKLDYEQGEVICLQE